MENIVFICQLIHSQFLYQSSINIVIQFLIVRFKSHNLKLKYALNCIPSPELLYPGYIDAKYENSKT